MPEDPMLAHLAEVGTHNAEALDDVADLVLACIRAEGLVLTAGAGHSLAAVAETFFRAGGLACVHPIYTEDLQVFGSTRRAVEAERRPGLARGVFGQVKLSGHDVLFLFSNSGVNHYPVELAIAAIDAGCPVVAVTSLAATTAAPRRAGSTVAQNSTIVLDTLTEPGDVSYPEKNAVTASLSSLSNVYLWNQVLVRLFDRAERDGFALPLWRSSNVEGGDEANAALIERYGPRIPPLS
ncbi:sugar isomerase domain-containing protein [Actinokineospora sp. HUAS TT18]|uniref:sugar isomerase domain-containing protein n=1 Tax=Actinokineospora sp. HUAS TT18 TaxID=3447451 RepID=UPI003F51C843